MRSVQDLFDGLDDNGETINVENVLKMLGEPDLAGRWLIIGDAVPGVAVVDERPAPRKNHPGVFARHWRSDWRTADFNDLLTELRGRHPEAVARFIEETYDPKDHNGYEFDHDEWGFGSLFIVEAAYTLAITDMGVYVWA